MPRDRLRRPDARVAGLKELPLVMPYSLPIRGREGQKGDKSFLFRWHQLSTAARERNSPYRLAALATAAFSAFVNLLKNSVSMTTVPLANARFDVPMIWPFRTIT